MTLRREALNKNFSSLTTPNEWKWLQFQSFQDDLGRRKTNSVGVSVISSCEQFE